MTEVFADAGYWIAIFDPRDRLHDAAMDLSRSLRVRTIVTTQVMLTEFLNHFAAFGPQIRERAIDAVRAIEQDSVVEVVPQSAEQFVRGVALYASRPDKDWGASDCQSFALMQERGITEAFAYDSHFAQAGFAALLRNS